MFAVGKSYPPKDHQSRIKRYRKNKELVLCNKRLLDDIRSKLAIDEHQYIYANYAGLICKKAADLLFGDSPIYSAGEEGSPEQQAIDRIVKDNALNTTNYEMANGNAYRGDAFYKLKWAQNYRGVLPEDADPYRVMIDAQNASYVFPETILGDRKKISVYHIAVPVSKEIDGGKIKWELEVEKHEPGIITTSRYEMDPVSTVGTEVVEWVITREVGESAILDTKVPLPLVVHVPNFALDDSWEGIDDISEHEALFREINNRLTQIATILDKHADPILTVPEGVLEEGPDGEPQVRAAYAKVFEVAGKSDVIPQYITWDGQLEAAFKEVDKLVDALLTTAEMPPVALGRENAGTSGATGLAVKYRMGPLLSKIARKRQYFDKALTEVIYTAQLLECAHTTKEAEYTPTKPHIIFSDGLPTDEREQAEIASLRTGGKPTMSVSDAIKRLDRYTDEQVTRTIDQISADEARAVGTVDGSVFNQYGTEDVA